MILYDYMSLFIIMLMVAHSYWIWGYYIGFHTYSFEIFMYNEFRNNSPQVLEVCMCASQA